jgi:hypothetical protein
MKTLAGFAWRRKGWFRNSGRRKNISCAPAFSGSAPISPMRKMYRVAFLPDTTRDGRNDQTR